MKVLLVTNMYPSPNAPAVGTFVRDQVESLRQEGVDIDVMFVNGMKSKMNYLWGILRLWGRLLTKRYDLIHANYVFSGIIARTQLLYPVVLTHNGHEVFQTWERYPSRMITRMVNKVIVRSREMKEKLGYEKAEIIPAGIDLDLFKPMPREEARDKLNLPRDKKLVLLAGHYSKQVKRLDIAKQAVSLAKEKDPAIEMVLVSGQPHEVVPLFMNACDALLLVSDGEGSPNVIKEAMACNLPIVSVPVGDVPDVIGNTEYCFLCTQDPANVAENLGRVLDEPRRTNGRENIQYMEQGVIARRIIALYQQVLQKKKGKSTNTTTDTRGAG